jgi:hypothetical protein
MRWTVGAGALSVLLLLVVGVGSGLWLANQDSNRVPLRAAIPFMGPNPSPSASATRNPSLNPASVTLTLTDLPSGYHVLSQGPASFSTGSAGSPPKTAAPPSWDVVFAGDATQGSGRRLVESLAVIYPEASAARLALKQVSASEASQMATSQPPPATLGSYAGQWIEHSPNGGPYSVIRLAWVTGSVVSQVSVLDVADPATVDQAVAFALMQQKRLAS